MKWVPLENQETLAQFIANSQSNPLHSFAIFKHSTRCSISSMAKSRMESQKVALPDDFTFLYLDLLQHRDLSNLIAQSLGVVHESPQLIMVKDGKAAYVASHNEINLNDTAVRIAEWKR